MSNPQGRLLDQLHKRAEHTALVFAGQTWLYRDVDSLARRYAAGLVRVGISRGDRIAVFAENGLEVVVALLAHWRLGVIHVPINPRYREEEAGHLLHDSGAVGVLVTAASENERILDAIGPLPRLSTRITIGPGALGTTFDALASAEPLEDQAPAAADDTAMLIYTSGTTGKSKGVELSYRNVVENTIALTRLWQFREDDRVIVALPLFHVHGLCLGTFGSFLNGATLLLYERFEASAIVGAFERDGATVFFGVPTMYVRLLEHIERCPEAAVPLRRARLFVAGSAALPADDFRAFEAATGHAILERYGMSETLFTLTNPYLGERRPGTVGKPAPGCEVRIVDDAGDDVPPGEVGELVVKGHGVMKGYWCRPEETAATFRDGWFLTGDVARRDTDGYVTILGRKSVDIIKSGGFKISAREIEDVLRRHPRVADVAVVGVPDRVWGQRIVAVVVPKAGAALDASDLGEELTAFAARHLADFKLPRTIKLTAELPRNALGKVQKHLIAQLFTTGE
ncbi:MAG: class I adenylate-forming enzyme family protein [Thermoanaerobaculales bacterium]